MARTAGIPLVDLFALTDQINSVLPQEVQDFVDRFAVLEHSSIRSPGAIIHHGKLQSLGDIADAEIAEPEVVFLGLGIGTLELPLVHAGLPFQLSMSRSAITNNLEPAADAWQLDISLADFILTPHGLEAAVYVPETGATPRHLLRDPAAPPVRIIGSATLRLQKLAGSDDVNMLFVDAPDPFDPTVTSGAVASLTFSPPHFFFGGSEVGMSVGQLLFDFSQSYSPPQILEQNQGPAWVGLAIREATVYAPRNLPVVGDLSGGVRDVLIGRPLGIQGEMELQFGRTALDPATFQFKQDDPTGPNLPVGGPGSAPGDTSAGEQAARTVTIEAGQDEDVTVHAGFTTPGPPAPGTIPTGALQEWTGLWSIDGEPTVEGLGHSGAVRHLSVLVVQPIEIVTNSGTETRFPHPPITFRFLAAGEGPSIAVAVGAQSFDNVLHLNGTTADIGSVTLTAASSAPGTSEFTWQLESGGKLQGAQVKSADFTPDVNDLTGQHNVVLKEKTTGDSKNRVTRLRLRIVDEGALLVGCEAGVFAASDSTTPLELAAVEATYDLSDFHASGSLNTKLEQAVLNPAPGPDLDVPSDGLAQVTLAEGPSTPVFFDRHIQIEMLFEEDTVTRWGELKPTQGRSAADEVDLQNQLLEWASHYPGADFLVIGRCDDIGDDVSDEDPDPFNVGLATDRAEKGRSLLTDLLAGAGGEVIPDPRVFTRGETAPWDPNSIAGDGLEEHPSIQPDELAPEEGITAAGKSKAVGDASLAKGWLIKHQHLEHVGWVNEWDTSKPYESTRKPYRRVDLFAVGGTPTAEAKRSTGDQDRDPTLRRSLVPSDDRTPTAVLPSASNMDYRVKLVIRWDSPTATEWKDAVPTLAEAEFAWTPAEMPLPEVGGAAVPVSKEVLTVYAKWVHDARTGFTQTTLGIRSDGDPEGLFATDQKNLTAALALGPALLSGVDLENDVVGSGARIAALLAAAAFAGVDLGGGGPLVGDGSQTAVIAIEAMAQTRSITDPGEDYQIRLTAEYVCTVHVNGGVLGIQTAPGRPMKIRYKQVGIEYDSSKTGWDQIGLAFDTASIEIEDSGQWMIDGVLGQLLRVTEIAFGRGSLWIEGRFAIAVSIGVVEISEAIIRLTFVDGDSFPRFELRGFVVKVDIPNTIEGEGRLRVEDDGTVRAGVDASIIPLGLGANAALAFGKPPEIDPDIFLSLFLGVQFSTPLPLAQSGAAIYGFKGLFTMNGSRKLGTNPDPVGRELDWWATSPENKYEPDRGQYALGVGVVVGTMPDVSFCFSASGMLVVAFPDPEVILGVDVKVIEVPDTEVTDEGAPEGAITGLIVIDDEAVKVAVTAQYEIPKVLAVKVPFGAYFPYAGEGTYVRLGSDGQTQHGRFGESITLTLLPGTLDAKAWAYLMIEQAGLPSLGGDPRFSFDGFSVGFGSGWGIDWSAGPIKLSASAKVLVGFGTNPLMIKGGVFVDGELDLVVVSVSARGELILTYIDGDMYLDGEFCGEVDLFFFSLSGCVGVSIGGSSDFTPPPPEPPIAGVSLVDRKDRVMGAAVPSGDPIDGVPIFALSDDGSGAAASNEGESPQANNTVWPDTAPVIHFKHYVKQGATGSQFAIADTPSQPIWFGGNRLKYTYRIEDVELRRKPDGQLVTGTGALATAWVTTPYRQSNSSGVDNPIPSEHEGPNLQLLDWDPWKWVVNIADGGASTDGDPVDQLDDLCDPVPHPRRACVHGRAATGVRWFTVRFRQEIPAEPPYPSRFDATGEPVIRVGTQKLRERDLLTVYSQVGASIRPGAVVDLPIPVSIDNNNGNELLKRGYRLPELRRAIEDRQEHVPLPWEATFDRALARPMLRLLVCTGKKKPGGEPGGDKVCTEFQGVKADNRDHVSLTHRKMFIKAVNRSSPFRLVDRVDASSDRAKRGTDGNAEIAFHPDGISITSRVPCREIELHFMKSTGQDIEVTAFGPAGQQVAFQAINGPQNRPLVARLQSQDGIQQVIVTGGGNEAQLFRICCRNSENPTPNPEPEPEQKPQHCQSFCELKPSRRPVRHLKHEGFTFTARQRSGQLTLVDAVDQSAAEPRPGTDRTAEILFPGDGMTVDLPSPCHALELWVMLFAGKQVSAVGFDDTGNAIAKARTPRSQRVPHRLVLESDRPITRVELEGGIGEAVLFRICCLDVADKSVECVNFRGLKLRDPVAKLSHAGVTFADLSGLAMLRTSDVVDAGTDPATPGRDRVPELSFSDEGLRISLPSRCDEVTVRLWLGAGPVKGRSLNHLGARTATAASSGEQAVEQVLYFAGPDITTVELFGGNGEARVIDVCCRSGAAPIGLWEPVEMFHEQPGATAAGANRQLKVRGIQDDSLADTWPGRIVKTFQTDTRVCQVIEFEPEPGASGPWHGLQVSTPPGLDVTVLSICGTDQVMVEARDQDEEARTGMMTELVNTLALPVEERREVLLEPGEEYEITVSWSWQVWQSNEEGTDSPPTVSEIAAGPWQSADPVEYHFAVAEEGSETGNTQDGLNEYVFDPRDVNRHLTAVEPADGRVVHFTDDPIWAHFDAGHVEHLLEQYGRELAIQVTRTDPPPQSTPSALIDALTPLPGAFTWYTEPRELQLTGLQRINDAVAESPCLPDGAVVGGASLAGVFDLAPQAMYDFSIIAPRTGSGGDPVVVNATRFTTSRYADPTEMMTDLGYAIASTAPYRPDDIIVPEGAALPAGVAETSDSLLGDLLVLLEADTLPLPTRNPFSYAVWRQIGAGWLLEGLLVDSLETMDRTATVVTTEGTATDTRCRLSRARVAGVDLTPYRASENWTRVFLKPRSPIELSPGRHDLSLEFETSTGPVTGRRTISHLPSIIEREGL